MFSHPSSVFKVKELGLQRRMSPAQRSKGNCHRTLIPILLGTFVERFSPVKRFRDCILPSRDNHAGVVQA